MININKMRLGLFLIILGVLQYIIYLFIYSNRDYKIENQQLTISIADNLMDSVKNDSIFMYKDCLQCDEYELCIETYCLYDSVIKSESNLFNPVCIKQELFFFQEGSILKKIDYPVNKIKQVVFSGNKIEMLENVIINIGVIDGKRGSLFSVKGYGGCNSCSEFYGLYSLKGELLWYSYAKKNEVFNQFGDFNQIIHQYGIKENIIFESSYKKICVYKGTSLY